MSDLTYDELVARNDRLARKIISMGDQFQATLRTEIKKAKVSAWDEGIERGQKIAAWAIGNRPHSERPSDTNPYREEP